jgi:putative serine protease PepD
MPGAAGDDHDDTDDHDDHDDVEPLGSPPHPLDRIWRHPSELPATPVVPTGRRRSRPRELGRVWIALAAAGAGAIVTLVILAAFGVLEDDNAPSAARDAQRVARDDAAVARLAAEIAPSIVAVSVLAPDGLRRGTGVCVRHSGDILTSNRLLRDATSITITTDDGESQPATVRGQDPATDLALLHVDNGLPAAPVAERAVRAGDSVLAVGAPASRGGQPWLGDGIVASIDGVVAQSGGPAMAGLIATNASPGTKGTGGALLDRHGTVAGIVLAPIDGDAAIYAVPIEFAARVADQLNTKGAAAHGWLGLVATNQREGPVVATTTENGPAQRAGIEVGDIVVAVGGRAVVTMGEVTAAARRHSPRATVVVKVRRGNELRSFDVVMGSTAQDVVLVGA